MAMSYRFNHLNFHKTHWLFQIILNLWIQMLKLSLRFIPLMPQTSRKCWYFYFYNCLFFFLVKLLLYSRFWFKHMMMKLSVFSLSNKLLALVNVIAKNSLFTRQLSTNNKQWKERRNSKFIWLLIRNNNWTRYQWYLVISKEQV